MDGPYEEYREHAEPTIGVISTLIDAARETLAFLGFPIDRRKTNDQLPDVATLEDTLQLHFRDFFQATINSRIIDIIESTTRCRQKS